jgi:hypothetical protein
MQVHYFTELALPVSDVADRIAGMIDRFESFGTDAYRAGEALYARVGPSEGRMAKTVSLDLGGRATQGDADVFPVAWWATGASSLFPRMEGELSVAPIGDSLSRLGFEGTYEPPLGILGSLLDRTLMRRVADSTVKSWVDRLAAEIRAAV